MHSTNFLVLDMMLIDTPRLLSEDEQKNKKGKTNEIKVSSMGDIQNTLFKHFG